MEHESIIPVWDFIDMCNDITAQKCKISIRSIYHDEDATFEKIIITMNPNRVWLVSGEKNDKGYYDEYLCIKRVKHFVLQSINENKYIYTIVCKDENDSINDYKYQLEIKKLY